MASIGLFILQDEMALKSIGVAPTPLVQVDGILAKLECVNPTGSVKDRIARFILQNSEKQGLLKPGMRIVEATSGNTGIAFAYHGRTMGYSVTLVMPEHMTPERIEIIKNLGADLILCSQEGGFAEAAEIRDRICREDPLAFNPDQFSNPLNVKCHLQTTGPELIQQSGTRIEAFVAGVGTGGTLMGVGEALKAVCSKTRIVAVEPTEAAVMSGGPNGSHSIFGIGDGFIPAIASNGRNGLAELIDEVSLVSTEEALEAAIYLQREHHLCVGISSGANFLAATRLQNRYAVIATIFPDGASKYHSMGLSDCQSGQCRFDHLCRNSVLSRLSLLRR